MPKKPVFEAYREPPPMLIHQAIADVRLLRPHVRSWRQAATLVYNCWPQLNLRILEMLAKEVDHGHEHDTPGHP